MHLFLLRCLTYLMVQHISDACNLPSVNPYDALVFQAQIQIGKAESLGPAKIKHSVLVLCGLMKYLSPVSPSKCHRSVGTRSSTFQVQSDTLHHSVSLSCRRILWGRKTVTIFELLFRRSVFLGKPG